MFSRLMLFNDQYIFHLDTPSPEHFWVSYNNLTDSGSPHQEPVFLGSSSVDSYLDGHRPVAKQKNPWRRRIFWLAFHHERIKK